MNFNGNISIRGGSVSADFSVGRGSQQPAAAKKTFGAKLPSALSTEGERARLRSQLDILHAQIRATPNAARLCDLVDDYLLVLATLAETPATPIPILGPLPAARILSAVIAALRKEAAAGTATGNVGPVVSGDNIPVPGHSLA
jgi:hypothetical protein